MNSIAGVRLKPDTTGLAAAEVRLKPDTTDPMAAEVRLKPDTTDPTTEVRLTPDGASLTGWRSA